MMAFLCVIRSEDYVHVNDICLLNFLWSIFCDMSQLVIRLLVNRIAINILTLYIHCLPILLLCCHHSHRRNSTGVSLPNLRFLGRCSSDLHSFGPQVQLFISRTCHATFKVSNHLHSPLLQIQRESSVKVAFPCYFVEQIS